MAQEVIGLKVEFDGSQAQQSVGSIRQQIKEASAALIDAQQRFGDYSAEAVAAAKKVAELKDRVQEASETAALFDPGAKFKAFGGAVQAVAGGFAAVQGALGLVGVESENLQKQLLKVQSALALSEGLSKITDSAKDFKRLGLIISETTVFQKGLAAANFLTSNALKVLGVSATTTSTGFKVLRGAIIATGIGALAIGIIAIIQNFDKLKAALLNAIPGLKGIADAIGNIVNAVTDFVGITSEAERATAKLLEETAEKIRKTERELEFNADKYDEFTQRKIKANLDFRKSLQDLLKDEKLTEDERNAYIKQAREKADREIFKADKDRQAAADEAKKKQDEKDKKAADEAKQKAKQASDAEKKRRDEQAQIEKEGADELAKLRDEAALAAIKKENERALKAIDIQLANDKKRIEATKQSEAQKQAIIKELEAKAARERAVINEKAAKEQADIEKATAEQLAKIRGEIALAAIKDEGERKREQIRQQYAAEIAEAEKGEGDRTEVIKALRIREKQELDAIDILDREKKAKDRIAEIEAEIAQSQADFDRRRELLDIEQEFLDNALAQKLISEEEYTAKVKALSQERINTEQAERDAKLKLQGEYIGLVQNFAGLARNIFEKNKGVQIAALIAEQGAAVAQIAVNTAAANAKAVSASPLTGGLPWTAINTVSAGIGIASAIANTVKGIRQIRGATPTSASAPGGVSIPQPGTASAPIAPQANAQVVGQELNREAINRAGSAATRAYVVESDVSSSQERIKRLERAARLG